MIACKSEGELKKMRVSGRVNASVLAELCAYVAPGMTTKQIDGMAEKLIRAQGGGTCVPRLPRLYRFYLPVRE